MGLIVVYSLLSPSSSLLTLVSSSPFLSSLLCFPVLLLGHLSCGCVFKLCVIIILGRDDLGQNDLHISDKSKKNSQAEYRQHRQITERPQQPSYTHTHTHKHPHNICCKMHNGLLWQGGITVLSKGLHFCYSWLLAVFHSAPSLNVSMWLLSLGRSLSNQQKTLAECCV